MNISRLPGESKLAVAVVLLIAARCIERVLYTRIAYDYTAFLWYSSFVILPVAFLIPSWPIVWYKMYFTNDITDEMRRFPHYKFVVMALFDTITSMLGTFPTPHIGGNLANVLGQLVLPFNMALAYLFLHTRFRHGHLLGAVLVIYGGLVSMLPILNGETLTNAPDPSVGWIALFMTALVPIAASNVYKEKALKHAKLDIWYAGAWMSVYLALVGLASIWTIRIPAFSDPPVPWSEFISYLGKAHRCFLGQAVEFNGALEPCDTGVLKTFLVFIAFNMTYSQLMLFIMREGSSVLLVVSSAVTLPLTDLLYMVPALTGRAAGQKFTIYDGFALFALVVGLLVYHSEKEAGQEDGVSDASAAEASPLRPLKFTEKTQLDVSGGDVNSSAYGSLNA